MDQYIHFLSLSTLMTLSYSDLLYEIIFLSKLKQALTITQLFKLWSSYLSKVLFVCVLYLHFASIFYQIEFRKPNNSYILKQEH